MCVNQNQALQPWFGWYSLTPDRKVATLDFRTRQAGGQGVMEAAGAIESDASKRHKMFGSQKRLGAAAIVKC